MWPEINLKSLSVRSVVCLFFCSFSSEFIFTEKKDEGKTVSSCVEFSVKSFYKLRLEFHDIDGFLFKRTHFFHRADWRGRRMQIFTQKPSERNFYTCAMECEKEMAFCKVSDSRRDAPY